MLNLYRVFAPFLDCVHSFGFKTGEDDEIWNGYRRSVYTDSAQGTKILSYGNCGLQSLLFTATIANDLRI